MQDKLKLAKNVIAYDAMIVRNQRSIINALVRNEELLFHKTISIAELSAQDSISKDEEESLCEEEDEDACETCDHPCDIITLVFDKKTRASTAGTKADVSYFLEKDDQFITVHQFYFKKIENQDFITISISPTFREGYVTHPAFYDHKSFAALKSLFLDENENYKGNVTIDESKEICNNIGCHLLTFQEYSALHVLRALVTGKLYRTRIEAPFNCLGFEDTECNTYEEWIDDFVVITEKDQDGGLHSYIQIGNDKCLTIYDLDKSYSNGYLLDFTTEGLIDFNPSHLVKDVRYQLSTYFYKDDEESKRPAMAGGDCNYGGRCGAFYFYCDNSWGGSGCNIGFRPCKWPEEDR